MEFDPHDWYWRLEGGAVYSSAKRAIVPEDEPDFVAWTEAGGVPRVAPDEHGNATLVLVETILAQYGIAATSDDLPAYAAELRYGAETNGIDIGGSTIATDRQSQALINGAFNLAQADPNTVFRFKTADGFMTLDAAAIQIIAIEVGRHVQACFAKEADVVASIASGSITLREQVAAAFAGL